MKIALKLICIILVIYCIYFPFSYFKKTPDIKEYRAAHILLKTEDEAKELKERLNKGEEFEKLAKEYSQCPSGKNGGDLGYKEPADLVKEFNDAVLKLPLRTLSEPFKTQFGWHIAKVYRIKYFSDEENFERRYYSNYLDEKQIDKFLNN